MTREEQQQLDIDALLGAKYQVLCRIGGGGMAQVLLARHRLHGGLFAVKILADHLAQDPSIVARFKQEATTAASLSGHPNIVPIFDIGEGHGLHYLVMQFVTGEDMASFLRREGKLNVAAAASVIAQAAEALCWAESKRVVHRDLKPANMHLDTTGRVKILDFGISKITDIADGLTRPGEALGTPFYMSPEQIRGEACDSRSDLYSLGVVFFELLTGHRPFENQSATAIQIAHLATPPPSVLSYDPTIPQMCDDIIQRLLRKDRNERYGSAQELLTELHNNGASSGPSTLRPEVDTSLANAINEAPTVGGAIPESSVDTAVAPAVPATTAAPMAAVASAPAAAKPGKSRVLPLSLAAAAVLALAVGGTALLLHKRPEPAPANPQPTLPATATVAAPPSTAPGTSPVVSNPVAETAQLLVKTKQPGVQVYVNGLLKGTTAANGQLLVHTAVGTQEVRVDKAGFKTPPSHSVTADSKHTQTLAFNMEPGVAAPPPVAPTATASAAPATATAAPAQATLLPKVKLQLSSSSILAGQAVTLSWHSENAKELSIEGLGAVELNGSRAVTPSASTNYTLIAKGPGGSAADSVHIEVAPVPRAAPAAPAPVAAAPAVASSGAAEAEREGVKQALHRYKEAYESESLDDLKQVWPTVSKDQQKGLKEAFKFNAIRLDLNYADDEIHLAGDEATVNCRQAFVYTVNGKKQNGPNTSTRITLHKQGRNWLIASVAAH